MLKLSKTVPSELNEAACTLCYAAGRHQNLTELSVIRQLLAAAYGKEYVQAAIVNSDGAVNATVVKKLAIATPCKFYLRPLSGRVGSHVFISS